MAPGTVSKVKAEKLPNLTALRFFAALLVAGYHFSMNGTVASSHGLLGPLMKEGFLGVALFFVLSGFVLAYNHPEVTSRRPFYVARFARVYPLLLFSLLVMLPFAPELGQKMGIPFTWWSVPPSLLLLQSWMPSVQFAVNGPAWTLSVEAFFYLLFPFLLPVVRRGLTLWWLWIAVLWVFSLALPILMDYPQVGRSLGVPAGLSGTLLRFSLSPPVYVPEFIMGMFAGARFRRYPRRFGPLAATLCGVAAIAGIRFSTYVGGDVARDGGLAIVFVLLVYVWAGYRSSLLASRPLQFGGEISYSMYLLQAWVLEIFLRLPVWTHRRLIMLVPLLVLSSVTYLLIEKPGRRLILKRFGVRARPKPIPTPAAMA